MFAPLPDPIMPGMTSSAASRPTQDSPADRSLLIARAFVARRQSHSPYSRFAVGAAVRTEDGQIFQGSNIENASYGLTMCAERVAIFRAVAAGQRRILALAISAVPAAWPCGACRQVLAEFADPSCPVIVAEGDSIVGSSTLGDLLPHAFEAQFLVGDGSEESPSRP